MFKDITSYLGKCHCSVCTCVRVLTYACVDGGAIMFKNVTSWLGEGVAAFVLSYGVCACVRARVCVRVCALPCMQRCLCLDVRSVRVRVCVCVCACASPCMFVRMFLCVRSLQYVYAVYVCVRTCCVCVSCRLLGTCAHE